MIGIYALVTNLNSITDLNLTADTYVKVIVTE